MSDVKRVCQMCGVDQTPLGHGISEARLPNGKSIGLVGPCCAGKVRQMIDKLIGMCGGYVENGTVLASPRYTPPIADLDQLQRLVNGPLEMVVSNYISDGPGYVGDIRIQIKWDTVSITTDDGAVTSKRLEHGYKPVLSAEPLQEADRPWLFGMMDEATKEHFESPDQIDLARGLKITFIDSTIGALLVFGEPEFVSVFTNEYGEDKALDGGE